MTERDQSSDSDSRRNGGLRQMLRCRRSRERKKGAGQSPRPQKNRRVNYAAYLMGVGA